MRNEPGIMLFLLYAYAAVGVSELCHAKVVKRPRIPFGVIVAARRGSQERDA